MSNTPTFAKDGEERPGQHMPDSSTNEINIPLSVPMDDHNPISSDFLNPLRPDVNNTQLPNQLPSSASSHVIGGLSKSDIEPTVDVKSKAEANEVPDTKTETKSIVSTESTTANVEAEHLFPTHEAQIEPALTANLKDEPSSQASETVTETRSQATKMETEPSSHAPASVTKPMSQEPKLEKESPSQVSETQTELPSPAMKSQTGPSSQEPKTKIDPVNPKAEPPFCIVEPETESANKKSEPSSQVPETELSYQPTTMEPGRPPSPAPETRSTSGKAEPPCSVGEAESETKLANPIAKPQITIEPSTPKAGAASSDAKPENADGRELHGEAKKTELPLPTVNGNSDLQNSFLLDENHEGSESGTEGEQSAFMKELENFFRERGMEFKPPKFYGEGLNCLKLWRAVMRLGGYDKVTSCKLWRQVGESFKPPKTCTTVSWTFRGFYEKALLEYERHKTSGGELSVIVANPAEPMNIDSQASGSGRARRDAAARAMQGWHSQRVLGNGEVSDPIIKDKNSTSLQKREKQLKSLGLLKRKKPSELENAVKAARTRPSKPQLDVAVVDIGQPAEWVKVNVQKTKDCFEVYALVPGLLREEVRVQSDPAGRLVISGEPEHPDNPWGVTPFKKVISLPARIDPHQTSAVVTLHGQLFVRVPFEQSDL